MMDAVPFTPPSDTADVSRTALTPDAKVAPQRVPLPDRSPDAYAAALRWAAHLDGAAVDDWRVVATLDSARQDAACWLDCGHAPNLFIDRIGSVHAALHPDRLEGIIAALDAADAALTVIERLTGWVFEPAAATVDTDAEDTPVRVTVMRPDGDAAATVVLSIAARHAANAPVIDQARARGAVASAVPLPVQVTVRGPALDIAEAGTLALGDMLMLGAGPFAAQMSAPTYPATDGHLDALTGTFHVGAAWDATGNARATRKGEAGMSDPDASMRAFRVPVTVRLPDMSVPLGTLESLQAGSTVALAPLSEGLRVTLDVAGKALARGEVVRMGDQFAVVIDALASDEVAAHSSASHAVGENPDTAPAHDAAGSEQP